MRAAVVAIFVAGWLYEPAAQAQPSDSDTADTALVHLDRGVAAFNAKDFHHALTELQLAHDLMPDKANPYRWLALTEIQLGDCASAQGHIDGFLSRVPPSDPRVAEMVRWREFCRRERAPAAGAQGTQVTGTQALTPAPAHAPDDRPLHSRWWFWPLIGTAAVVATGAVVYVATDHNSESMLPAVHCDSTGCHP